MWSDWKHLPNENEGGGSAVVRQARDGDHARDRAFGDATLTNGDGGDDFRWLGYSRGLQKLQRERRHGHAAARLQGASSAAIDPHKLQHLWCQKQKCTAAAVVG